MIFAAKELILKQKDSNIGNKTPNKSVGLNSQHKF